MINVALPDMVHVRSTNVVTKMCKAWKRNTNLLLPIPK